MTQAEHGERLYSQVNDAASKVDLLKGEVAFNETLGKALENIRGLRQTLRFAESAIQNDDFSDAVDLLKRADGELLNVRVNQDPKVAGLLHAKIQDLRYTVAGSLTDCWKNLLYVDSTRSTITIRNQIQRG